MNIVRILFPLLLSVVGSNGEVSLDPNKVGDFQQLALQQQQRVVEQPHQRALIELRMKYQLAIERAWQNAKENGDSVLQRELEIEQASFGFDPPAVRNPTQAILLSLREMRADGTMKLEQEREERLAAHLTAMLASVQTREAALQGRGQRTEAAQFASYRERLETQLLTLVPEEGMTASRLAPAAPLPELGDPAENPTIKKTRTGEFRFYGLVKEVIDVNTGSFVMETESGPVLIELSESTEVGLMFRERDNLTPLQDRKVTLSETGKSYRLPEDLYVYVPFASMKVAGPVLKGQDFRDGFLSAKPLEDHLPTEREPWLSGKLTGLEKGHITAIKLVTVEDQEFKGTTSGFNYAEQITALFEPSDIQADKFEAGVYGQPDRKSFKATRVFLKPISK
ncbi:MAG: hypothetical protein AAGH89_07325 [Verrucomicrobiota bacterium]